MNEDMHLLRIRKNHSSSSELHKLRSFIQSSIHRLELVLRADDDDFRSEFCSGPFMPRLPLSHTASELKAAIPTDSHHFQQRSLGASWRSAYPDLDQSDPMVLHPNTQQILSNSVPVELCNDILCLLRPHSSLKRFPDQVLTSSNRPISPYNVQFLKLHWKGHHCVREFEVLIDMIQADNTFIICIYVRFLWLCGFQFQAANSELASINSSLLSLITTT